MSQQCWPAAAARTLQHRHQWLSAAACCWAEAAAAQSSGLLLTHDHWAKSQAFLQLAACRHSEAAAARWIQEQLAGERKRPVHSVHRQRLLLQQCGQQLQQWPIRRSPQRHSGPTRSSLLYPRRALSSQRVNQQQQQLSPAVHQAELCSPFLALEPPSLTTQSHRGPSAQPQAQGQQLQPVQHVRGGLARAHMQTRTSVARDARQQSPNQPPQRNVWPTAPQPQRQNL